MIPSRSQFEPSPDPFEAWQTALACLKQAVGTFLDACATLHQAIDHPRAVSMDRSLTEANILQVYNQMGSVETIERKMFAFRALLHRIINGSTILVPVNVLPPELLCRVFELTIPPLPRFYRNSFSFKLHPLVVIPSVCVRWHRITTTACSLWSHIDIGSWPLTTKARTAMLERVQTWLERAHGAPLHLNFRGKCEEDLGNDMQLAAILQPHMASATSLAFRQTDDSLFRTMLGLFASFSSRPLTSLVVDDVDLPNDTDIHSGQFTWPMSILHGVVDLQLSHLSAPICPSLDELASILSNSPHLRTLHLQYLDFVADQTGGSPKISFPGLRTLRLTPMNSPQLQKILSALAPGSHGLDVRLDLPDQNNSDCIATIQAFFQRSNVTHLFLQNLRYNSGLQLADYLDCMPGLQFLAFNCAKDQCCDSLSALFAETEGERVVARCPSLQVLQIINGLISQRQLKRVVQCYRLREMIFGGYIEFTVAGSEDMVVKELFDWLRLQVEKVVYDSQVYGLL
ncbi:hypothetical protein FRC08_008485 [Ceratobasidium sp. 394]|nr:hypothetical protein FRC08_008485 [Ceratobasidium sp. 394]KAG9077085.1 hypothetical protein FS749_011066 [Ceratobasidium sp. UAMH 11750]